MAEDLGSAVLDLAADGSKLKSDLASGEANVDKSMQSLGAKSKALGATLTKTLTVAAAALALVLKKAGEEWNGMVDALRVGTGATGKELDKLADSGKRVGAKVSQPLSEVGQVLADLATRTGLTGKPLENLAVQLLELQRQTKGAAPSVEELTRLYGDWGIAAEDMGSTNDKLFKVSQAAGIGIDQLASLMVQFGTPLRRLGLDFDQSAAMFAKFEKEGVNIQTVMPGLRQALGNFAEAGKDPAKAFTELIEKLKSTKDEGKALQIANKVFGKRAGADMYGAIIEGKFDFEELIDAMQDSEGVIVKTGKETQHMSDRFAHLRNRVVGIIGPFGEVGAAVMTAVAAIGPALFGFGVLAESSLGKLMAGWVKSAATAVWSAAVQVAKWAWVGAQALLNAAKVAAAWIIAMGPIAIVIAAVIGLAVLIVKHWDKIKRFLVATWNKIKEIAAKVWNGIKSAVLRTWKNLTDGIQRAVNFVKSIIAAAWNAVTGFFSRAWNKAKEIVTQAMLRVVLAVREKGRAVLDYLKAFPGNIVKGLGNLGRLLWNAGKSLITGLWNGISSMAGWIKDKIIGMMKNILPGFVKKALGISSPSRVFMEIGERTMEGLHRGLQVGFEADVSPLMKTIGAALAGRDAGSMRGARTSPSAQGALVHIGRQEINNNVDAHRVIAEIGRRLAVAGSPT